MMRTLHIVLLFITLVFSIPTSAQSINPCSYLFDEGSIQRIGCNTFLDQRAQLEADDARVAEIAQRISALSTSFDINSSDPAWVIRITPVAESLLSEISGIMQVRLAYIRQSQMIEIAIRLNSGIDIPQVALDQLLVDSEVLQQGLSDMNNVQNNAILLRNDLVALASTETDTTAEPEITNDPENEIVYGPEPAPLTNQEILSLANGMCATFEDISARNACIFRIGLVWLQAEEFCSESTDPNCLDEAITQFNSETVSEEEWEERIDDMNALDDPYAAIAVQLCELNPQTDDENVPITLSQCAQIEYLEIAEDVNGDADSDGLANVNDFCPNLPAGNTPDPTAPGCPLSEAVSQQDSDNDGILNSEDLCPETIPGDNPDPDRTGCPLPVEDWSILSGSWAFFHTAGCGISDTGTANLSVTGESGFWTFGSATFSFILVSESAGLPVFFTDYNNGVTATWVLTDLNTLVGSFSNGSDDCRIIATR